MHLKRLELVGFKSFADRTVLDFSKGLNTVVGPNGSGKSNIADALRWVLGEQSARQLRGGKMEDIIFSGTAHRRPLGYAEIIMRIDNLDNKLPLEFAEISVARRVYRSGESEYSINGEPCRLKDIQLLFMDTGVGRDGYSIIGQGRIDEILSLRSEDRRHIFEEAAGIGKFKNRRNDAMSKLERERQNRVRVDDIIQDLEEQLEPLEGQAKDAKYYLELRENYKNTHINIFLTEMGKIDNELAQIKETQQNSNIQFDNGKRQLNEARLASEGLKKLAANAEVAYRNANEVLLEATTALEKNEGDNKLLQNKIDQIATERERLTAEVAKRKNALAQKEFECKHEDDVRREAQEKLDELNKELMQHQQSTANMEETLRQSSARLEAFNQAIVDALTASANNQTRVADAESAYLRLEDEKEQLNGEIELHDTKIAEQQLTVEEAGAALLACEDNLKRVRSNVAAYAQAYQQLAEENNEIDKQVNHAQESVTIVSSRHRALADLEAQHEGFLQSVKTVLRKKASDPKYAGICGAVSELISVDSEYEVAIETALGGAAQNIVTLHENDAKMAINMLKDTKSGRATFMPLTSVRGKLLDVSRFTQENGFIDIAANLVTNDIEYDQIVAQLLGDVLVMDNMDNALAFNKKQKHHYKIVTQGGERLAPGGAITGGTTGRQSASLIGRRRQLDELMQKLEFLQSELDEATRLKRDLVEKRQATEEALQAARENEQSITLETERQRDRLNSVKEIVKHLDVQASQYDDENQKKMQQLVEMNLLIRTAKAEQRSLDDGIKVARKNLENYQRQIERDRQDQTEEAGILTDLKIEISRRTEWVGEAKRNVDRLKREGAVISDEIKILINEISATEDMAKQNIANCTQIASNSTKLKTRLAEVREQLTASEQEKVRLDAAIVKAEEETRTHADSSALLERELARLEMRKEQLDDTSHRLHNEVWEEYGLTYQKALSYKNTDISEAVMRRSMQDLRAELAGLSDVNIGAIEAYKQIKTRYDFLSAQRDDILMAEATLVELIGQLTKQMEDVFAAQFTLIDQHFQEVFRQMFSGGKASLRLMDTQNVLESGIEIIAQPPGKSLQNLMLLSGGERALTAIALLFAILRLKPSPFCVLDEIESALDDANVLRFASYLKEYAVGTQFIIITHRKGTMEVAEHMYGVTMEEQGISKLVSVRFED